MARMEIQRNAGTEYRQGRERRERTGKERNAGTEYWKDRNAGTEYRQGRDHIRKRQQTAADGAPWYCGRENIKSMEVPRGHGEYNRRYQSYNRRY